MHQKIPALMVFPFLPLLGLNNHFNTTPPEFKIQDLTHLQIFANLRLDPNPPFLPLLGLTNHFNTTPPEFKIQDLTRLARLGRSARQ